MYEQRIQKQGMVSFRCLNKKAPPEVLEHPERHDYTINFILADFFGIVKEVWNESKNPKNKSKR